MKKFNGFENWLIKAAVENYIVEAEKQTADAEKDGKRCLFAVGYFTTVGKEISQHIDDLTEKPKKQK